MKVNFVIIVFALTFSACAQMKHSKPLPPNEIKGRLNEIIQRQRSERDFMSIVSCPIEMIPAKGRHPDDSADTCAANPENCLERCKANDGDACYFLALVIQEHDKIENDVAQVLFQRSCEFGIWSGCTNRAADIFENGKTQQSDSCAARTFQATCAGDDPWGCTMYGFVLGKGIGIEKDISNALLILRKACDISIDKNGPACKRANEVRQNIEETQKPN